MNSRILVSGVSGPIGVALLPSLRTNGCSVVRLVRGPAKGDDQISWDPAVPLEPQTVSGFDAVIHLAGESIFGRWTAAKKSNIRDSRVVGTFNLSSALAQAEDKPKVFVCGSAIGYYGNRGDEALREESAPGTGFLAEVVQDWEEATTPAVQADIRTVHIRTGVILSPKGGALGAMLTPFKLGLGGRIGSGQQWMSWIDVRDMVGAIHHILKNDLIQGAGEYGGTQAGQECGVCEDAGQRAVAASNFSHARVCGETGVWRDGGRTASRQPKSRSQQTDLERISVSISGAESVSGVNFTRLGSSAGLIWLGALHLFQQLLQQLRPLICAQFPPQFFQRQRDDVVVVRASVFGIGGDVEPEFVHEFDILRTQARVMWANGVLAHGAIGSAHFQAQARTRLRHALPCVTRKFGLLVCGELVGKAADHTDGIEPLRRNHDGFEYVGCRNH